MSISLLKMTTIFLLYIVDGTVKSKEPVELSFSSALSNKYPLLWIGTTTSITTANVVYDKRSTYIKCKNQKRYYSEYMELFKYIERNDSVVSPYTVCLAPLETGIVSKEAVQDRMMHHLFMYRMFHGDRLVLSPDYRRLLEKQLTVSLEKTSDTPTEDCRRERLNAKSKRYYARHKEAIKARRHQRRHAAVAPDAVAPDAVIENTAQ